MKKLFYFSLSLFLTVVTFTSCSNKSNYASALPESPVFVAKVNVANLLNESELLQQDLVKGMLMGLAASLDGDAKTLLENVIKDPESFGLSLSDPAYFAVESIQNEKFMFLLAVKDYNVLSASVQTILSDKSMGGVFTASTENGVTAIKDRRGNKMIAFDNEKMVIARDAMVYMIDNSEKHCKNLNGFIALEADAAMFLDYEQLYEQINRLANSFNEAMGVAKIEQNVDFTNAAAYLSLDFEKGKVVMRSKIIGMDKMISEAKKVLSSPDGALLCYAPNKSYGVAQMNVKDLANYIEALTGKEIAPLIEEINNNIANKGGDLKVELSLLNSIKGDVMAAVTPILADNDGQPQFMAIAECADSKLFDAIISLSQLNGAELTEVQKNVYALNMNKRIDWENYNWGSGQDFTYIRRGYDYYLGYEDGKMFIVPENFYSKGLKEQASSFKDNPLSKKLEGIGSAVADIKYILENINENVPMRPQDKAVLNMFTIFDNAEFTCNDDCSSAEFTVNLTDTEVNALRQFVSLFFTTAASGAIR